MNPQADGGPDYHDFFAPRALTPEALQDVQVPESEPAADAPAVERDLAFPTGEPRVDDAVARLDDLAGLPVDDHIAVFDEVSRRLHDALAGLDS